MDDDDIYYDNFQQEYNMNKLDAQLRFKIKDEIVCCSRILFLLQSNYDYVHVKSQFDVEYQFATVESVKKFAEWIDSKNKTLNNLDDKMYLILAKLASIYKVPALSNEIYEILHNKYKNYKEKKEFINPNINSNPQNDDIKNRIIKNFDFLLNEEKLVSFGQANYILNNLRYLNYKDKVEILRKAIDAGKKFSLLSSFNLFTKDELSSNDVSKDLAPLFQLSKTGFLFYLNSYNMKSKEEVKSNDKKIQSSSENDKNKQLTEMERLRIEFNDLNCESEELFANTDNLMKQYKSIENDFKELDEKIKNLLKNKVKQEKDISSLWNKEMQEKYVKISKGYSEANIINDKIDKNRSFCSNLLEMIKNKKLHNYIFSKMFYYNISYQYVNDSTLIVSAVDPILDKQAFITSIDFKFKNDESNSFICDFNDEIIFHPIYYELGFCNKPSNYSWDIFAKFQNNFTDDKSNNSNNNSHKYYNTDELKEDNVCNEEWHLVAKYDNLGGKIEDPDESYDPCWDDPFILKFKYLPAFFPKSIKLHLNDVKDLDINIQKSLKNCFNHFKIVGICNNLNNAK